MTKTDRKKLAKAARALAMECVAGTAPEFGHTFEFSGDGSPYCVLGHVVARAGLAPTNGRAYVFADLCPDLIDSHRIVAGANDVSAEHDALPWALLYLADELESAR